MTKEQHLFDEVEKVLSQLTLQEKISLVSGKTLISFILFRKRFNIDFRERLMAYVRGTTIGDPFNSGIRRTKWSKRHSVLQRRPNSLYSMWYRFGIIMEYWPHEHNWKHDGQAG